jgi:prepilin-type N-terminal cleavage/methylation domain-containing protein
MGTGRKGHGLLEIIVALTILTIVAGIALPRGWDLVKEYRLRGASYYFRGLIREVRAQAAAKSRYMGIVFDEVDGEPELSLHVDGNDNGIRRADVRSGVDPRIRGPWRLSDQFPGVRYGSPLSGDEPMFPPLRIGRGRILSFSPIGTSTSGTLFLSNEQGFQYAVIILGSSGRVRLARYRGGQWEPLP